MPDRSLSLGTLFTADVSGFLRGVERVRAAVRGLDADFRRAGKGASDSFDRMGRSSDKASSQFSRAGTALGAVSQQATKAQAAMSRLNQAFRTVAVYGVAASAIYAVINAFKAGAQEIVDYDQALKNLQAITRSTDAEVAGMGETIKDVAETTKFSTGEVAEGMVLLGQAGFSASEAINSMQAVANLATGTLSDMRLVTDLMTSAVRAFNLDATESTRVADVMANAINRSKLTVDKLRVAFNFVGAAAAQTGLSLEETAASMGVLANNGIRASTIGTGLRQVMSRLLAPSAKLREAFKEQGIALDAVNPRIVGIEESLKRLSQVLIDHENNVVDMGKTYQLFGLRGAQAAAILIKEFTSGGWTQMLENVSATGTASEMASKQMEGLGVKLKNLADRAKLIAVAFGEAGVTGALKILIDMLRSLAAIIADIVSSGIGRFAVTIGLLAVSFGSLGKVIKGVIFLFATLGARVAKLDVLLARFLVTSPWAAYAAAIGVVVGGIVHYVREQKRALEQQELEIQKVKSTIESLDVYKTALEELLKKKNKNREIDKEYERVLGRLSEQHEEIAKEMNKSTDALEENIAALEKFRSTKVEEAIKRTVTLIKQYRQEAERVKTLVGIWEFLSDIGDQIFGVLVSILQERQRQLKRTTEDIIRVWERFMSVVRTLPGGEALAKGLDNLGGGVSRIVEYFRSLGAESETVKKALDKETQAFVLLAKIMKEGNKSLEEAIALAKEMGATSEQIEKMTEAFEKQELGISDLKKQYEKTLSEVPDIFKDMYEELDFLRKADLVRVQKQVEQEEAALEQRARIIEMNEHEIVGTKAAIRARALIKFAEDLGKETKTEQEIHNDRIKFISAFLEKREEMYNESTTEIINTYFRQKEAAEGNAEELEKIEENKNDRLLAAQQEYNATVLGIQTAFNDQLKKQQKEVVEEMNEAFEQLGEDLVKQLEKKYDELSDKVDEFTDKLKDIEQNYHDDLRDLRRKSMTDEEKYYDTRAELNRVLNEARLKQDSELYDKARDLAKDLAREVKDSNGQTVISIEKASRRAAVALTTIYEEQSLLIERQRRDTETAMNSITKEIQNVVQLMESYKQAIDDASRKKLELQAEEAIAKLKKTYDITSKFKKDWDSLKSKEITLTVRYKYVGNPPGGAPSEKSTSETESGGGEVEGKQFGGRVPGYGGGDKHPALLEGGEFVLRKEAVKAIVGRFGTAWLDSLNEMREGVSSAAGVMFRRAGGFIKRSVGGYVPSMASSISSAAMGARPQIVVPVTIGTMTGSTAQARQMGKIMGEEIEGHLRRQGLSGYHRESVLWQRKGKMRGRVS